MKTKILIVGAGPAGLAAAYALASQPNASSLYDITVLVKGERLGGKCGGGRHELGPNGVVSEHGLHILMSCYKKTLPLLRDCYERLGLKLEDALTPAYRLDLAEVVGEKWCTWPIEVRPPDRDPHVLFGNTRNEPDELEVILQRIALLVQDEDPEGVQGALARYDLGRIDINGLHDQDWPAFPLMALLLAQRTPLRRGNYQQAAILIDRFQRLQWIAYKAKPSSNKTRRNAIIGNLLGAIFRATHATRNLDDSPNYTALDEFDLRALLLGYGATTEAVESAPVQAGYAFVFAGRAGGSGNGFAAGTAVRGLFRIMCTNGPLFYSLNGSGPSVLIVPLYKVLKLLNVKFDFFSYVKDIVADGDRLTQVDVWRQVQLKSGTYTPPLSADAAGPAWREDFGLEADYEQIEDGATLRQLDYNFQSPTSGWTNWRHCKVESLRVGYHFDAVVLAADPSAWRSTCPSLVASNAKLTAVSGHLATTATQTAQLWGTLKLTGASDWPRAGGVLANNPPELDTFADVTSALRWDGANRPESLVYLCGRLEAPLPTTDAEDHLQQTQVKARLDEWLALNLKDCWPDAAAAGSAAFVGTHAQANVGASDRYVESRPGTTKYRPGTADTGLKNLLLAGDWVNAKSDELRAGCFETAVASGLEAGRAIPALELPQPARGSLRRPTATNANTTAPVQGRLPQKKGNSMPDYIEVTGDISWQRPFLYTDVRLFQFFVKTPSVEILQRWVDGYLNFDSTSPIKYKVVGNFAILQFTRAAKGTTIAGSYPRRGYTNPEDAAVSLLVSKYNTETETVEDVRFVNCSIYVDSPIEMAIGRETYGMLKVPGTFECDHESKDGPSELEVSTPIVDKPGDRMKSAPVLRVVRTSFAPTDQFVPFADLMGHLLIALTDEGTGIRIDMSLISDRLLAKPYPSMVGMRQLRDSANPSRACFQEVTEIDLDVPLDGARGVILSSGYAAHFFTNHESVKLPETLGFEDNEVVEVALATSIILPQYTIK
jgi:uncharacterized protein with NAD-binding domain and iron-sulfur cluster